MLCLLTCLLACSLAPRLYTTEIINMWWLQHCMLGAVSLLLELRKLFGKKEHRRCGWVGFCYLQGYPKFASTFTSVIIMIELCDGA